MSDIQTSFIYEKSQLLFSISKELEEVDRTISAFILLSADMLLKKIDGTPNMFQEQNRDFGPELTDIDKQEIETEINELVNSIGE